VSFACVGYNGAIEAYQKRMRGVLDLYDAYLKTKTYISVLQCFTFAVAKFRSIRTR